MSPAAILVMAVVVAGPAVAPVDVRVKRARSLVAAAKSFEQVRLLSSGKTLRLSVEALRSQMVLSGFANGNAARLQAAKWRSRLCPLATSNNRTVVVTCLTRQFDGELSSRGTIDIWETRGTPWRGGWGAPPRILYQPRRLGLGGSCPGTTAASRGECALHQGRLTDAVAQWNEAVSGVDRSYASLRLGDDAIENHADMAQGLEWYAKAGHQGPFGRLAVARLCEWTGRCLTDGTEGKVFDARALPEPVKTEMDLRHARTLAFAGRTAPAIALLLNRLGAPDRPAACVEAAALCEALLELGLNDPDAQVQRWALEAYLRARQQHQMPANVEVMRAAARVAERVGAPKYAANMLATLTDRIASDDLGEHLRDTARLYRKGGDDVRAGVIVDFARARLRPSTLQSPAWKTVLAEQRGPAPAKPPAADVVGDELRAAEAEVQLARVVIAGLKDSGNTGESP